MIKLRTLVVVALVLGLIVFGGTMIFKPTFGEAPTKEGYEILPCSSYSSCRSYFSQIDKEDFDSFWKTVICEGLTCYAPIKDSEKVIVDV